MKSSDQRYRHVQRTKRDREKWEVASRDLAFALRAARLGEGDFAEVERAINAGAAEFSHILLACGRTATDFRRNYRVGAANWHIVNANNLCPIETLQPARLDGFVLMRLSREQTKNVKLRWAKLRAQDVLIHDPQSIIWARVIAAHFDGSRDEHLGLLEDLRERGVSLVNENSAKNTDTALERSGKEMMRYIRQLGHQTPDWYPAWSDERIKNAARFAWYRAKQIMGYGVQKGQSPAEHRLEIEKALVVAEAFLAGESVRAAYYDPDTSRRHTRLKPRLDRLENVMGDVWRTEQRAYRERRQREREEARKQATHPPTSEQLARQAKSDHRALSMLEKREMFYPDGSPEPERLRLALVGTEWQRDYGPERWPIMIN